MVSYPSINFGNTIDSNLKNSTYLVSAFAEDGEDEHDHESDNDSEDKIKTTNNANDKSKDNNNDHENETEDDSNDKSKDNHDDQENETEIEVEVKNDKAKVKIKLNGDEYRFVVKDTSESAIIAAITDKTALTEDQIKADWDFEIDDHSKDSSDKNESQINENIIRHENKSKETADDIVLKLQQKIDQLEQRLQDLLNQFETGKYFGTVTNTDHVPNSYTVSFTGTATSLDDNFIVTDVDGDVYLESISTGTDSFKLRITGGEILVGDTFYDFVFGKARLGNSDGNTSMILLGQIMDDQGNVSTIRLTLDTANSIISDFGAEPVPFSIDSSRSKIAKQWGLDATGDFSLV